MAVAVPAISPKSCKAPFAATADVNDMAHAMIHIGTMNVAMEIGRTICPAISNTAPARNNAMPLTRHPCCPQRRTNTPPKRLHTIMTRATVAKTRLNMVEDKPSACMRMRGAVEK